MKAKPGQAMIAHNREQETPAPSSVIDVEQLALDCIDTAGGPPDSLHAMKETIERAIAPLQQELEAAEQHVRILRELNDVMLSDKERYREVLEWIVGQQSLFFAECSQAEEIIIRCKDAMKGNRKPFKMTPDSEQLARECAGLQQELEDHQQSFKDLRCELNKWKEGCERNAECWRDSVRQCDEQRLKIVELESELAELRQHLDRSQASEAEAVTLYEGMLQQVDALRKDKERFTKVIDTLRDRLAAGENIAGCRHETNYCIELLTEAMKGNP